MRNYSALEFVKRLRFGWNLGNTLDASSSEKDAPPVVHETAWKNPVTTEEMVKLLKDTGFDTLRVPVSWTKHIGQAPDYLIDNAWINRVKEVVDYGINNELFVILNLHHEDWHFPSNDNYEKAEACLINVWHQIAKTFEDYGEQLIFEAMNEPRMVGTDLEWKGGNKEAREVINKLNAAFIKTVKKTGGNNVSRQLMIPTYAASGDEEALKDFIVPDYNNLIVSVHAYTPYTFALLENGVRTWSKDNIDDTKDIDALFARLNNHFLSKGIPVILGETGCVNRDNLEARIEWTKYYAGKAVKYGVPCIWWDNGLFAGEGELFGIMDRQNASWKFPEIVDAFLCKNI